MGTPLPSLRRRLFRCVSIRENTDGTFAITAVQHVPEKEPSWITGPALSRSQAP
ncbi:host specificity protein [Escherichia coli]|uniref:Host specificity protein n=1 Tax=Escherichia coli TaxID=562 RepID=A0A376U7Z9_ECOLX|nr:host specificity protein [Escherichia coli]